MQYNVSMNIHKQPLNKLSLIDQVHTARKYLDTLAPCIIIHFTGPVLVFIFLDANKWWIVLTYS